MSIHNDAEEDFLLADSKSKFLISYFVGGMSGFLMGITLGWVIWG